MAAEERSKVQVSIGVVDCFVMGLHTLKALPKYGGNLCVTHGMHSWSQQAVKRMLAVYNNDRIRRILHVRRQECVPTIELR